MTAFLLEVAVFGALLGLPFLYEARPALCYYLKFLCYYIYFIVNSIFFLPIFMLRPRNVTNLCISSGTINIISNILGIKWTIQNKERLEPEESYIVVSNHQSSIDILGQFQLWRPMKRCTVVAKSELFWFWPFGLAAWLCGIVFIARVKADQAKMAINDAVQKIKADNTKLWVFPEGTRRNTGEIHEFKKGAFHAAITAQIPVLPVVFSRYYFMERTKRFDRGEVIIHVLEPISTKGVSLDDLDSFKEKVREKMCHTFKDINKQVLSKVNAAHKALK